MEDCSKDERLQQETLCHVRQWTDEYVERPETLMRQNIVCCRLDSLSAGQRSSSHRYLVAIPCWHFVSPNCDLVMRLPSAVSQWCRLRAAGWCGRILVFS